MTVAAVVAFLRERAEVERAGGYEERCRELADGGRFRLWEQEVGIDGVEHCWLAEANGQRYGYAERIQLSRFASDEARERVAGEVKQKLLVQAWMTLAIVTGRVPEPPR